MQALILGGTAASSAGVGAAHSNAWAAGFLLAAVLAFVAAASLLRRPSRPDREF